MFHDEKREKRERRKGGREEEQNILFCFSLHLHGFSGKDLRVELCIGWYTKENPAVLTNALKVCSNTSLSQEAESTVETRSTRPMMVFYYKREAQGIVLSFATTVTRSYISYVNRSVCKDIYIYFNADGWILSTQISLLS